jgi:hypothetical protein
MIGIRIVRSTRQKGRDLRGEYYYFPLLKDYTSSVIYTFVIFVVTGL